MAGVGAGSRQLDEWSSRPSCCPGHVPRGDKAASAAGSTLPAPCVPGPDLPEVSTTLLLGRVQLATVAVLVAVLHGTAMSRSRIQSWFRDRVVAASRRGGLGRLPGGRSDPGRGSAALAGTRVG
jgi:hypothetical protein